MSAPDDVIISGMSGRFPESDNVYEFRDNLYNKVDMITENMEPRWTIDHPEVPKRGGLIRNLSKFDASFFAVHYKQAHSMDPMCRMLLELAYEAIVDAGVNPATLRGTRTGCFIGACYSESEKIWLYERIQSHGFGITGCSRAMLANRISYWLDIHGPSFSVDTACSSSLYAMDHALRAIRSGQCDAALVGGANLTLHPYVTLQFARLGVLSKDGRCKSFDDEADGYCRSEGVVMIFLQKAKDAKRIYATVVHSKTNQDGFKEQGITFPSGRMQSQLLEDCYKECGISPLDIKFIEAHGTGTKVGDPEEVNAIDRVLCQNRKEPLLIGSIKSNIGHSEPASAVSAVVKVILAMESGLISPNLHYKNPRKGIAALEEGRIKVVSDVTPWEGGMAGINSFGFGGGNAHAVLRSNPKKKAIVDPAVLDGLPRLVVASGRTEEAVETILHELETRPVDSEYVALLLNVHAHQAIPGHIYRGFTVLHARPEQQEKRIRDIQHYPGAKRPIWFVFAGMGSQWPGMGRDLLQLPTFSKAIDRCDAVLRPRGLDIRRIITDTDPKLFDNILNAFVGIAAVQIGLVDVLRDAGVQPDGIVGHSVGELGCAYADGCFTAEQMVLAAYSRGLASLETPLIHGAMAAVGMSHEALIPLCPEDVEVACHNGKDSSTISGPAESVSKFVAELKERGVFAREVACSNIAYHSRYIAGAGPRLLKYLKEVIPEPNTRSSKWVSSSVTEDSWSDTAAQYSSAEYHTNNLLRPVLFAEALQHVPKDAITIEIAPHGLLQAILRRTLPQECTNIALTQRGTDNALDVLFAAFGKLFIAGVQPDVTTLQPPVQFPVSRGTPMISPLVRWQHSDDWHVSSFATEERMETGERTVSICVLEEESEFYKGHMIDGRNLFPATGYLVLVWESLAMMNSKIYTDMPVVFEDVKFLRASHLPKDGFLDLTIMVTKGTGTFEVIEGGAAVVTGRVMIPEDVDSEYLPLPLNIRNETMTTHIQPSLYQKDVYKELRLRGYHYSGLFKGVTRLEVDGLSGEVRWDQNWISFMDCMMQCQIMQIDSRSLYVPTAIRKLVINPQRQAEILEVNDRTSVPVIIHPNHKAITAGGVQVTGLRASAIARRKNLTVPVLENQAPLTYHSDVPLPFTSAFRALVHIVLENSPHSKLKIVELVSPIEADTSRVLAINLPGILENLPLTKADMSVFGANTSLSEGILNISEEIKIDDRSQIPVDIAAHMVLCGDGGSLLAMKDAVTEALQALCSGGFILVSSDPSSHRRVAETLAELGLSLASILHVTLPRNVESSEDESSDEEEPEEAVLVLARKVEDYNGTGVIIHVEEESNFVPEFRWVSELQKVLAADPVPDRVYLVSQHAPRSGLLGLIKCLREEAHNNLRAVWILDEGAPEFSLVDPFYTSQLRHDLLVNVLLPAGGGWASYRHLPVAPLPAKVTHAYVEQAVRGDLSSFQWLQGPIKNATESLCRDKHVCHIYFSSLNFKDVMTATGKLGVDVFYPSRLNQDCPLGLEYSGRENSGKRVMGMLINGGLSNLVLADPLLMWEIPSNWTMEEAATVPVVYCTAYYALVMRGRMRAGESVLIHSGTGGVGQAAINIALHMGCTVYVTVGTAEKRAFLHKNFPQIPDANIGNSRDTSFEQLIMERTQGQGVDLVLNSLAGEKLQASVRCLRMHGRFLEIGKVDMAADSALGMFAFLKDIGVHGILLDSIIVMGTEQSKRRLHEMLTHGIRSGAVKPLVRQVFGPHQVETAYRFMASGKHIGKVLIRIREEEDNLMAIPEPRLVGAIQRFYCDPTKSYVVVGGLGGFGLELADWLILRGARKLVLCSRSGVTNGYQAYRIQTWESYGVSVTISRADLTCEQGCITLLESAARKLGPVDVIFNLAVVLRDAVFENQDLESFTVAFMPKARVTQLLDLVSRRLCTSLRNFVVFSSVSCGRGNAGQSNYGLANSVMERICEERRLQGFPALAVQWGAVGDVGLVAEHMATKNEESSESFEPLEIGGTLQQSIASCLSTLDAFLNLPETNVVLSSMVVAEKQRAAGSGNVVDTVVNILGIKDIKTVSLHSTLAELGMDSMMAVEIKQTLEREFEMFLTPQDIRTLTFARLQEKATDLQDQSKGPNQQEQIQSKQDDQWLIGGLQHLLSVVGSADVSRDAIVSLPSLPSSDNGRKIFIVPGVEGFAWVMEPLAKQLNTSVICLQLPLNSAGQDVSTLAERLLKNLQSQQAKGPYLLVGYSYGTVPLLEVAWELQQQGQTINLWLLDGAPDALQAMTRRSLNTELSSEAQWQTSFLEKLLLYIGHADAAEVGRELIRLPDWPARLAHTALLFPDETHREFHASCVDVVLRRFTALMDYKWPEERGRLRCPVTLVRTEPSMGGATHDYGLDKICENLVTVHTIEATHSGILLSKRTADIINEGVAKLVH